jgi:RiboL-PSP-HEPN
MKLAQIDRAIDLCEEHVDRTDSRGTEIEAFLTQYLLVLICAAFEEEIERIVIRRLSTSSDPHIESFAKSALDAVFRSTKTGEIAGLLNRFGSDYKEKFTGRISGTRAETYFNNIVIGRHAIAHSMGSTVTLRELIEFYKEGHTVLDAIVDVCSAGGQGGAAGTTTEPTEQQP